MPSCSVFLPFICVQLHRKMKTDDVKIYNFVNVNYNTYYKRTPDLSLLLIKLISLKKEENLKKILELCKL